MKINGTTIKSVEMLQEEWQKPNFKIQMIWECIENGTLEDFEKNLKGELSKEIEKAIRKMKCENSDIVSDFLKGICLDWIKLYDHLEKFFQNDIERNSFFTGNKNELLKLLGNEEKEWHLKQVYMVYIFLLLHIQVFQEKKIREEDVSDVQEMLQKEKAPFLDKKAQERMCIDDNGKIYWCYKNRIMQVDPNSGVTKVYYEDAEEIAGITYGAGIGLIAFTVSGNICGCTAKRVREVVKEQKIIMASAFGRQYILLTDKKTIISSMNIPQWQDVSWVHMGLNSASVIIETNQSAISYNCSFSEKHQFCTGVRKVVTYKAVNKEKNFYAILNRDGLLQFDSGEDVEQVEEMCMGKNGYFFVKEQGIWFREYGKNDNKLVKHLNEEKVEEMHAYEDLIVYRKADKEVVYYSFRPIAGCQ